MHHLQLLTQDFELQIRTEIFASSFEEFSQMCKDMVKDNKDSIGKTYRVWVDGIFSKESIIMGYD